MGIDSICQCQRNPITTLVHPLFLIKNTADWVKFINAHPDADYLGIPLTLNPEPLNLYDISKAVWGILILAEYLPLDYKCTVIQCVAHELVNAGLHILSAITKTTTSSPRMRMTNKNTSADEVRKHIQVQQLTEDDYKAVEE